MNEKTELAERLRRSRRTLRLTQQTVADRTGIPRAAISEIERGLRKVDSLELQRLAATYRQPASYFLDGPSDELLELAQIYAMLSPADQRTLITYAQYLRTTQERP